MNYLQKKKMAMMNSIASGGRLPSEYQEVEYIQSHTAEYINTGYIPSQDNTRVNVGFELTNESGTYGDKTIFIWGVDPQYDRGYKLDRQDRASGIKYRVCFGDNQYTTNLDAEVGTKMNVEVAKGYADFNGTTFTFSQGALTVTNPMLIFAVYRGSNILTGYGRFIFYYMQIYDNGTLVRDFVPCYRKSDNVIGLYDLVNDTFYTNAGSGTFTKGQDV